MEWIYFGPESVDPDRERDIRRGSRRGRHGQQPHPILYVDFSNFCNSLSSKSIDFGRIPIPKRMSRPHPDCHMRFVGPEQSEDLRDIANRHAKRVLENLSLLLITFPSLFVPLILNTGLIKILEPSPRVFSTQPNVLLAVFLDD